MVLSFVFLKLDLLYDLIQAKETFESDHVCKLEISIAFLKNLKSLELNEKILNYQAIRVWGELFCFYMGPLLNLK